MLKSYLLLILYILKDKYDEKMYIIWKKCEKEYLSGPKNKIIKKSKKVEKSCWQNQTIVIIYSSRLWDSKSFTTTTKIKSKKLLTNTTKYDIIEKFHC